MVPTAPQADRFQIAKEAFDYRLIGNVLLSNTTVCEASRLLLQPPDGSGWCPDEDALRVLDLMSLIESTVLHERIFCLPATLPEDVARLELRTRLIESNALAPLPKEDDHNVIGKALVASLSTVERFKTVPRSGIRLPLSFEDFRPALIGDLKLTASEDQAAGKAWARFGEGYDYAVSGGNPITEMQEAESFDEAARNLISWMDYAESGAYETVMESFRAMYYVFASEHYGLPYLASASVQSLQRKFPNYFQASVREKLYQQLATTLRATVNQVAQEFEGVIVFVPPFSALVLDRASTRAEIVSEALALRAEYSGFRKSMCELERNHLEARSLNDRMKALREIERLGKEVARPFDEPSQMKLESALRYIPNAVDLAANPTNPVGWGRLLLNMPTDRLISWYRRRPVAKLVRTARAVGALPDYDGLLTKHFGRTVASSTLETMNELQA